MYAFEKRDDQGALRLSETFKDLDISQRPVGRNV
jgi:hypothetical protein